jgi:hypothetical protein
MATYQQFLYVLITEVREIKSKRIADTELRIVFWPEDRESETREHFVVYGNRPDTKKDGEFVPYRLVCDTMYEVTGLVNTLFSSTIPLKLNCINTADLMMIPKMNTISIGLIRMKTRVQNWLHLILNPRQIHPENHICT